MAIKTLILRVRKENIHCVPWHKQLCNMVPKASYLFPELVPQNTRPILKGQWKPNVRMHTTSLFGISLSPNDANIAAFFLAHWVPHLSTIFIHFCESSTNKVLSLEVLTSAQDYCKPSDIHDLTLNQCHDSLTGHWMTSDPQLDSSLMMASDP